MRNFLYQLIPFKSNIYLNKPLIKYLNILIIYILIVFIAGCKEPNNALDPNEQSIVIRGLFVEISKFSTKYVTLTWNDSITNVFSYEMDTSPDGNNFISSRSVQGNIKTVSFSGVYSPDSTYYFRVRAIDHSSETVNISNVSFASPGFLAPSNLVAEFIPDTLINLSWSDRSNDEDGFEIEQSTDGINFQLIKSTMQNLSKYSLSGLYTANDTYYFRVRAKKGNKYTPYTNVIRFQLLFNEPTDLKILSISEMSIKLKWKAYYNFSTQFSIERAMDAKEYESIGIASGSPPLEFVDNNLNSNSKYKYRIRAFTPNNFSDFSNQIKITPDSAHNLFYKKFSGLNIINAGHNRVDISPDGKILAIANYSSDVQIISVSDGTLLRTLTRRQSYFSGDLPIYALAFDHSSKYLLSGMSGYNSYAIVMWDVNDGSIIKTMIPTEFISGVSFNSNANFFAGGCPQYIYVWKTDDSTIYKSFNSSGSVFNDTNIDMTFVPEGDLIIGNEKSSIVIWNINNGSKVLTIPGDSPSRFTVSQQGTYLATFERKTSSTREKKYDISIWNIANRSLSKTLLCDNNIGPIAYSTDGKYLATANLGNTIELWNIESGLLSQVLTAQGNTNARIKYTTNDKYMMSYGRDGSINLWERGFIWIVEL